MFGRGVSLDGGGLEGKSSKIVPQAADARRWEVDLEAGQVLFVPSGCAHSVTNLTDTAAISANFVDSSNVERCLSELQVGEFISESKSLGGSYREIVQCNLCSLSTNARARSIFSPSVLGSLSMIASMPDRRPTIHPLMHHDCLVSQPPSLIHHVPFLPPDCIVRGRQEP